MNVVAFIEPPQTEVIEKILKHCDLCQDRSSRAPPDAGSLAQDLDFSFSDRLLEVPLRYWGSIVTDAIHMKRLQDHLGGPGAIFP